MAIYTKPHLSYSEQVDLLIQRGLRVGDSASAEKLLSRIGYYRLSGYWYPFRLPATPVRRDTFQPGTTLDQVVALYDFDRQLKLLILDAVERVEIAMRVRVGHILGNGMLMRISTRDIWILNSPELVRRDARVTMPSSSRGCSRNRSAPRKNSSSTSGTTTTTDCQSG